MSNRMASQAISLNEGDTFMTKSLAYSVAPRGAGALPIESLNLGFCVVSIDKVDGLPACCACGEDVWKVVIQQKQMRWRQPKSFSGGSKHRGFRFH